MGRADALKPGRRRDGHLPLARSELPIDTVSLARYLIGKVWCGSCLKASPAVASVVRCTL
jgi:hypothetical protein